MDWFFDFLVEFRTIRRVFFALLIVLLFWLGWLNLGWLGLLGFFFALMELSDWFSSSRRNKNGG